MKRALLIFAALVVLVLGTFLIIPSKSSPEKMAEAFQITIKKFQELETKDSERGRWEIYFRFLGKGNSVSHIVYSQQKDNSRYDSHDHVIQFHLSEDSTRIICNEYQFVNDVSGSWMTFGSGYEQSREFRNADDFLSKIDKLLCARMENPGNSKDLCLSKFYPAPSIENVLLSFNDE